MNNAAKELNDLYAKWMRSISDAEELRRQLREKDVINAFLDAEAQTREAQQEFCEKLVAERPKHPRGTWRKWIEANCEFSYGQARSYKTFYERETNIEIARAANAGRRSLAWDKIKDRVEQFGEEVVKPFCQELFDSLEDDERLDAQLAMKRYLESCCESAAEDGEGHQAEEEN
jgi:hypothetical protein